MTGDESVRLIAIMRAAYPAMTVVEGMGTVWHETLGDLRYDECVTAVLTLARETARIPAVADIRLTVLTARRAAAGAERREELTAAHGWQEQPRVPMPDWFWSSVAHSYRNAQAGKDEPQKMGSQFRALMQQLGGKP